MSNMKKLLDIMNETTVSGSIAAGPAVGLGTQRRVQEEDSDDGTKAPDAPKAKEFGLWKNSVLAGAEQRDKKKSKKVAESKSEERNEMDTPAVQSGLKKMAARHNNENWTKEQLADLGRRLASVKTTRKNGYTEFNGIDKAIIRSKKVNELDCGSGQRQLKLAEENISEEQLLAKELARRLDLFMKGLDRELGKKSSDRGIQSKTEPSTGAMREDNKSIGPDKNDPFEKGWRARYDDANPYEKGTKKHQQWQNGQNEREAQPNHYDESVTEQYDPATAIMWINQVSQLAHAVSQMSPEELVKLNDAYQSFYKVAGGAVAGGAATGIGGMFYSLMKDTLSAAKSKARVDTEEIIQLQRQIVSIHKRLKTLKSEPAIAKYQAMLKQAYEVLEELESRQGNQVAEGDQKQLSVQQLATISDEALDNAYHYGRSSPGNTFGWQANLKSAAYAKQMIDKGITDIEAISDAIHKGWNVTAKAFVQNPDQFDDTEKLKAAGKLEAKLQQREKLMNIGYAQLPDEEQEKDRVVARALLQALKGQQDVAEDSDPCWSDYKQVGMKKKNGKKVPNCVPKEGVAEAAKWRTHPDAHDHDTDGSPVSKGGIKSDPLSTRQGVSRTQSEKDPKSLAGKFGDKYAKKHGVPTKQLMKNIPLNDIDEQGMSEGFNEDILDKLKKSWDWLSFKDEREGKQETGEEWAARYMKDLEGQRQDEREGKPIRRNRAKDEMMANTFSDRDERDVDEGVAEGLKDTIKKGVKNIKRGMQGWNDSDLAITGTENKPRDVANRAKNLSDKDLKDVHDAVNAPGVGIFGKGEYKNPTKHSPAGLQKHVLDREIRKRGLEEQDVAEKQIDELSVHKMLKYSNAAEKDRDELNQKWDNRTASEKEKERVLRHEKGEQRAADKIKQKTGKLPGQMGKLDRLKHAITREGVTEGTEKEYHVINHRGTPTVVSPSGKMNKNFSSTYDAQQFAKKKNAEIGKKKDVAEDTASVKYGVFSKGGSVGDQKWKNDPIKTFDNKEEAIAFAKHRRAGLSKGEKAYYRMSYVVKPIKNTTEKQVNEHGDPWEDPNYDPRGGGETRSPEQIAKDNAEHAILSKRLGLKNTNKLPDIKDDMLKMMNHFMGQHSKKKDVDEASASSSRSRAGLAKLSKLNSMTLDQQKEYLKKQLEISDKRRQARDDKQRAEYDKKMALKSQLKDKDDAKKDVTEATGYKSQFPSAAPAIQYAKDKVKTFRDPDDGIEIWSMPDGGCDVVHTSNSNGRNHCIDNRGKKLGTIRPQKQGNK